jgi:hypothetical protein
MKWETGMYRLYWPQNRSIDAAGWMSAPRASRRSEIAIAFLLALYVVAIIAALIALS